MNKIFAFIHPVGGPLPIIDCFLLSRKQKADFCFFSSESFAKDHFYDHCVGYWFPEEENDIKWAEENIWVTEDGEVIDNKPSSELDDDVIEEFARRYSGGFDKHIFEIELNKF